MAIQRFGRRVKHSYQSYGFGVKLTVAVILGLCFVVIWSVFSPPSYSVTSQRDTFDDIAEPISANGKIKQPQIHPKKKAPKQGETRKKETKSKSKSDKVVKGRKRDERVPPLRSGEGHRSERGRAKEKKEEVKVELPKEVENEPNQEPDGSKSKGLQGVGEEGVTNREEKEEETVDGENGENEEVDKNGDLDQDAVEKQEEESEESESTSKKNKNLGPLFDPKTQYSWKLCDTRSKQNYIPCIDMEVASGRMQSYRHHERSCPRTGVMCLVPLPHDGYETPVSWPESRLKIWYKNVEHPKLAAFIKTQDWVVESGEFLTFSQNQSAPNSKIKHYLESMEEMVPDLEWGKNIRVVLDIGCTDSSLVSLLLEKDVLTLTLGLKDDLVDLAQIALERGFPAIVSPFATRRLPFPSGVFDAIHCSECQISWQSSGGKLLLEMNRILRPGGYFILSTKHESEAMSPLTASICWNILAHKTDEVSDVGVKVYQKPEANDIYDLRRKKIPPICKDSENPDAAWYIPIKACLHTIPAAIEQHGTEWPEEWPKRLETFPDWMTDRERLVADSAHWKAIVNKSYSGGMGIDWSKIRNVMDMKAINGGFAAALAQQKVWVMNVIPVHAPDTLPIIFERGLIGVYHDWCESFGTYPRSYDLLHADHLFSRLKNRCKNPVVIVVEMDRLLRPGGWAIFRDKVEILDPLEGILKSLQWEIRMTFAQGKEGILCVQKTSWRPEA